MRERYQYEWKRVMQNLMCAFHVFVVTVEYAMYDDADLLGRGHRRGHLDFSPRSLFERRYRLEYAQTDAKREQINLIHLASRHLEHTISLDITPKPPAIPTFDFHINSNHLRLSSLSSTTTYRSTTFESAFYLGQSTFDLPLTSQHSIIKRHQTKIKAHHVSTTKKELYFELKAGL